MEDFFDDDGAEFFPVAGEDAHGVVKGRFLSSRTIGCKLPAALAVCFIPYYDVPPRRGGWHSFLLPPRRLAVRYFFRTGNPPPGLPVAVDPWSLGARYGESSALAPASFPAIRASKEFRACFWLRDCVISNHEGRAMVEANAASLMGYTPIAKSPNQRDRHVPDHYLRGVGTGRNYEIIWKRWGVSLRFHYGFRIAKRWARIGNTAAFGGGIPFMRLRLRYDVHLHTGYVNASFAGTHIPSASYQLGDKQINARSMEDITRRQILITLGAGQEQNAPLADEERELDDFVI